MFSAFYSFGPGAVGGLSSNAKHPATAAFPVGGHVHGPQRILEFIDPASGNDKWRYRYENQLGSLTGMADETTAKLNDYTYLDYGRPVEREIAYDGDHDEVEEVGTTHSSPNTTISLPAESFTTDEFKGMQLMVSDPANGAVYIGTVQSNTGTTIVVDDFEQDIINGIEIDDLDFVVYDLVDTNVATSGNYHTAGEWTSSASYSGGNDETTLTDSGADFNSYMEGWLISLTAQEFSYVEIKERVSAWQIKVKGDVRGLTGLGNRYWIIAPPHVDPSTGAMNGDADPVTGEYQPACDSHYLWGLYRYQPPMVGFYVDPDGAFGSTYSFGTYGAQTGANMAGWHDAGARRYDPAIGRWTTPDPAMSPVWNLFSSANGNPMSLLDPTGLAVLKASDFDDCDELSELDKDFITDLIAAGWSFHGGLGVNAEGNADSDTKRSEDDRWEIDYNKKEVKLDYWGPASNKCIYINTVLGFIRKDLKLAKKKKAFRKKHGGDDKSFDAVDALDDAEKEFKRAKDALDALDKALGKGGKELPDSLGKAKKGLGKALKAKKLFDVGKDCLEFGRRLQKLMDCGGKWNDTMTTYCTECMIHMKGGIPGLSGLDRAQAEKDCKEMKKKWNSRKKR